MADKLPPVSHTFHANYVNCPRKAFHVNIAKDLPKEDSEALRWGNQVHKAMEERINKGTPLPSEMGKYESFVQFGNYNVKAEVKLGLRENGQPCGFFDSDVWMRGVLDVLIAEKPMLNSAFLMDWKTGKKREDSEELELHAVLLRGARPALERITGSYVWLQEISIGQAHDLSATETKLAQVRATRKDIEHAFALGSDAFPPRQNPLCGWCPVKSCEFNPRK